MKRILQIFGEPLASGGQEAFIMNIYRAIDKSQVQFDFFTPFCCTNPDLRREIENLGGKVFEGGGRFLNEGNKNDFVNNLSEFLLQNKYDTVHIHSGSIFSLCFGAKIAKKHGAKKIIVHSHATGNKNIKHSVIKFISRKVFLKNATHYCACSKIAAEWKFPDKITKNNRYHIIPNGIDTVRFTFSDTTRNEYREKLCIKDRFVLCHVGRFSGEKNHPFLLDVYKKVKQQNPDACLLLVGEGPDRDAINEYIAQNEIKDVHLLGVRSDISEIMQAADVFVFPSLFEGLGIAAIEAQSVGLPTFCSEFIPDEANATPAFKRLSVSDGADRWAKAILSTCQNDRKHYSEMVRENGFDSASSAQKILNLYLENI